MQEIRRLVANYRESEGCSCCEGDTHTEDRNSLCEFLGFEKYKDGSGYDYSKFVAR